MKKFSAILIVFVSPCIVYSAPSISSGSGTKGNGNSYTITGSGFGAKAQFGGKPYRRYDFESNNQSASSDGSDTSTTLVDENMSVSNTARGDFSAYTIKSDSSWVGQVADINTAFPAVGRNGKLYWSFWKKISSADDYTTSIGFKENWKFVRLWPNGGAGGYPNFYTGQPPGSVGTCTGGGGQIFYVEQGPVGTHRFFDSDYTKPDTTWRFEEWLMEFNSSVGATDGELYVYQDGVLKVSRTNFVQDYSGVSKDSLQGLFIQHDPSNISNCSGSAPTYDVFYDDPVFDYGTGSWARVLLANHATFSSATHFEYQPATAWSDTSVTFVQRFGSFAAADTVYAHLCDAANSCTSTGQEITSAGNPAPTVTGVVPSTSTTPGGGTVVVHGTGILTGAQVVIGTIAATSENVLTSTAVTAVVPARSSTGTVNVTITNTDAQSGTMLNAFTYVPSSPTVSDISPNTGTNAGGTLVTITGTNLAEIQDVTFGGVSATNETSLSETAITCITPVFGSTGAVDVKVAIPNGTSVTVSNGFTYTQAPADALLCPCPIPQ